MKVLTICDRYNWGGASQVAKSLHEMLLAHGHSSIYLYGYDKKGLASKKFPVGVVSASYTLGPHINYLSYSLVGKNIFPSVNNRLNALIAEADIIHIHNIHDYGFNYEQLTNNIKINKKPVVITCHDSWYFTGRCSISRECMEWQTGCRKCIHREYYHKSIFDYAGRERVRKLHAFGSLPKLLFVSPSRWMHDYMSSVYGSDKCELVSNAVDTNIFKFNAATNKRKPGSVPSLLVVANDFKDRQKVDIEVIDQLVKGGIELHIVGSNSPFTGINVVNHGALNASQLSKVMNDCDIHLFMSKIDNQPLVVLESLCAGMLQLTFKTKAVTGLNIDDDCIYLDDHPGDKLVHLLRAGTSLERRLDMDAREKRSEIYRQRFSRQRMYDEYISVYHSVLEN